MLFIRNFESTIVNLDLSPMRRDLVIELLELFVDSPKGVVDSCLPLTKGESLLLSLN